MDASVAKKQTQTQAEARLKVSKALRREEGQWEDHGQALKCLSSGPASR
jgi:hypothetical protein